MSLMKACMEIVSYQLKPEARSEKFMEFVHRLQTTLSAIDGFVSREVFYREASGVWVELIGWESEEAAKLAETELMRQPCMVEAMELIETSTVQMHLVRQVL